jgi:methionine aminotransferase
VDATPCVPKGLNQYPPMTGVPMPLRQAVVGQDQPGCTAGATTLAREITVTAGATQAILTAVLCHACSPATKSSCWSPATTATLPNIELAGGTVVRVPLTPGTSGPTSRALRRR